MSSSPCPHTTFLHGQKNVSINGSYFQQTVNYSSNPEPGLSTLLRAASLSAAHDASDRDPPPRCAQGTREEVISDIIDWITDFTPCKSVMWLNGPFGNGKSAVMQTIADRLRNDTTLNHLLAATFFFGRGKSGREKAKYLIPTIAYQIAITIPGMRQAISNVLIQDPTILSKSIDAQLRLLITNPLHEVTPSPFHTPTVLIDGLDECEGHDYQRLILKAIFGAVLKEHIPLRFLIASRPESQIGETFRTQPLDEHHYSITLVDDSQTREELRQFLRSGFDEMCQRRLDLVSMIKHPWPSEEDLSTLEDRASGQFLYASTVLRFVDSDMSHPTQQLALILERRPGIAFSNMDELYTQILESCPCQETLPSFLHSLLTGRALKAEYTICFKPTLANYAAISGLQPNDISVILRWLPAIIKVEQYPSPQNDLPDDWPLQEIMQLYSPRFSIHHQSFIEFITDHTRSGRFHVDLNIAYRETKANLDILLAKSLSQGDQSPRIHPNVWEVADGMLLQDLRAYRLGRSLGWPHLQQTLHDFRGGRIPHVSRLCPEFLDALRHVLGALEASLGRKPEGHITIQEFLSTLRDIYDRLFFLTVPPDSKVWKIAGALALASVLSEKIRFQHFEPGWISYFHHIHELPQLTGLPLATVFRILEENWNFFRVDINHYPHPENCRFFIGMQHHEAFLEDEHRSGNLYLTYRNSAVHALKFGQKVLNSVQQLDMFGMIFTSFCAHGWDIRIDEDLRKGSVMSDVIELLLHNNHIIPKNLMEDDTKGGRDILDALGASHVSLQWLIKQLQILTAVAPNHNTPTIIHHLRDIVDRSKEDAIILSFDCGRQRFWSNSGDKLRPYDEVVDFEAVDRGGWDLFSFSMRKFYSDISFLLSGISGECHASILRYHLHALISWIYFLIKGWSPPGEDGVKVRDLDDQFEGKLDGVQWEFHLSRANACKIINDQLLTIHYIFAIMEYDYGTETRVLELLPTPLVIGGLAWFRKHYETDKAFETWCEGVIATRAKLEACPISNTKTSQASSFATPVKPLHPWFSLDSLLRMALQKIRNLQERYRKRSDAKVLEIQKQPKGPGANIII